VELEEIDDVLPAFVVPRMLENGRAMPRDVVVAAVGPVCAAVLKELGVTVDVMPAAPNMASLITAVGEYFELTGDDDMLM
jgi:uroporphyrinogen-III synthase